MATSTKKDDGIDLLYPDLLSKDGLLFNLRKRYVRMSSTDLESLDKEALVDLYNQYILPLPQRKYRDNLRGREMKKKQIIRDKRKRKFTPIENSDTASAKKKERLSQESPSGPSKGLVNSFSHSPDESRLKPPPSCIDTSKKVLKLSSASTTSSKQQEESDEGSNSTRSSMKVIKLNCNTKSSEDAAVKRPANDSNEKEETSTKKKFKPIQWP